MKKKIIIVFTLVLAIFSTVKPAEAHFLATDGNIGGILHVDPNDQPIALSQASFFFEFKDKQNKFTPQNCDCTFEINENGKNIYSQPLFQNNSNPSLKSASVFYTFPQRDIYEIKVTGKPNTPNAFQPFTLIWNFRVDQQAQAPAQNKIVQQNNSNFFSEHFVHIIPIGIFLIFFIIYFFSHIYKSNNSKKKGGEKRNDKKDFGNIY